VATGLNFGAPLWLGGKLADICLIRVIAYSKYTKNLGNLVI